MQILTNKVSISYRDTKYLMEKYFRSPESSIISPRGRTQNSFSSDDPSTFICDIKEILSDGVLPVRLFSSSFRLNSFFFEHTININRIMNISNKGLLNITYRDFRDIIRHHNWLLFKSGIPSSHSLFVTQTHSPKSNHISRSLLSPNPGFALLHFFCYNYK